MYQSALILIYPLLRPTRAVRWFALVTLVLLVTLMLLLGSQPEIEKAIPNPPWDKLAHLIVFGGYGTLAWITVKGASQIQPVMIVGLMNDPFSPPLI